MFEFIIEKGINPLPSRKAALTSRMEVRVVKSIDVRARNLASACTIKISEFRHAALEYSLGLLQPATQE